jgi:ATP phosphoribosyltransferase regulatory subunit HisZ
VIKMSEIERYIGRMLIPKMIDLGYAGNAIIRELRNLGYGYRYQNMLADIREQTQIAAFGASVKNLAEDVYPSKAIMTDAELSQPRRYRIFGTAKYVNVETGIVTYEPVSFYTDTLNTKQGWMQEYITVKEEAKYREDVSIEGLDIFAIEHNTGFSY